MNERKNFLIEFLFAISYLQFRHRAREDTQLVKVNEAQRHKRVEDLRREESPRRHDENKIRPGVYLRPKVSGIMYISLDAISKFKSFKRHSPDDSTVH